jgi:hypothetical protein
MKRPILFSYAALLWVCGCLAASAEAAPPPASCRRILLVGHIETPPDFPADRQVQLSMTYQMNYQKNPAILFLKYPLSLRDFIVSLYPSPPLKLKKSGAAVRLPESLPETSPWSWTESKPETQPESQPVLEQVKLGFIAEKMFLYPREIKFRYYAETSDGVYKSDFLKLDYLHEKRQQADGSWQCESEVKLEPVVLKKGK